MHGFGAMGKTVVPPLFGLEQLVFEVSLQTVRGARRPWLFVVRKGTSRRTRDGLPVRVVKLTDAETIEARCLELSVVGKSFFCCYAASPAFP